MGVRRGERGERKEKIGGKRGMGVGDKETKGI